MKLGPWTNEAVMDSTLDTALFQHWLPPPQGIIDVAVRDNAMEGTSKYTRFSYLNIWVFGDMTLRRYKATFREEPGAAMFRAHKFQIPQPVFFLDAYDETKRTSET